MPMQFTNLENEIEMKKLNGYLTGRSYMNGYSYSEADLTTFKSATVLPDASKFPHMYRWYVHIASIMGVRTLLASGVASSVNKKEEKKDEDEDEDDLFGDDEDEDEDDAAAAAAAKKRAEAAKAKKKKAAPIERSQVVLEVKPWEAETDLEALAIKIKATEIKGLKWGEGHKLVPVAFGIKKLLVQCIIIDSEVLLDDITDVIEAFEDEVQSVDCASMNKM